MLQGFLQGIRELTFPDNCFLCRHYLNSHHEKQLCPSCLSSIQFNHPPFCLKCSRHLRVFNRQGLCSSCLTTHYEFDVAWGTCIYEPPLVELIHAFKYYGKTGLKRSFHQWMVEFIETYKIPLNYFDIIMPLALHPSRYRERGFNQSQLLSFLLAEKYHLNHRIDILKRQKFTPSQTTLTEAKQRWTNVKDAFRIDHSLDLADKNILIVDDLLTTAATANAASYALKHAGAAYVGILTLAITP